MTTPDLATAVATAPVTDTNGAVAAPAFAVGLPPLTELPDPPQIPDMPAQLFDFVRAISVLADYYSAAPDTVVLGNCYLAPEPGRVEGSLYPDCLVAFAMPRPKAEIEDANGYVISELGKPPNFVLEIASPSTGRRDYTEKRDRYAALGIPEYWRFDTTGGRLHDAALAGDRLTPAGVYERLPIVQTPDGLYRGYSTALDLELRWDAGKLRFWNPNTGDYVPDIEDNRVRREAAEARLDTETAAHLATADQLDAAIIDRDAYAAAHQAETTAHQATQAERDVAQAERDAAMAQLDDAQQLIIQLQARLNQQQ